MTIPANIAERIDAYRDTLECAHDDRCEDLDTTPEAARASLESTIADLAAERDAAVAKCAELERIAEQSRREGQEIAAGLHERIAELERELAAANGKLARINDWCHLGGRNLVPRPGRADSFGDGIRQAQHAMSHILSSSDACSKTISAAEQGGAS